MHWDTYLRVLDLVLILTPGLRPLRPGVRMHAAAQAHVLEFCTFGVRIIQTSRGTLLLACSPVLLGCRIAEFSKTTVSYVYYYIDHISM